MSTPTGASETTEPSDTRPAEATVAGTRPAPVHETVPEIGRGVELGRYLIVQELGRGATGRVWSAYDGDLDRKVAIKVVAEAIEGPERRKRLLGEAQAMAKIRHPNVVLVHDVGTHAGHLYIAMEFVEGTTLGRWCRREPPPTLPARLEAMIAAARGLAAAHAVGLVHRDFKPDNVLVDHEGRVRVADFGLAQPIERPGPSDDDAPSWSAAVGTPAYMSPEHHGLGVVDARSDQFSFSVALFEALAGRRPFAGTTIAELASAALHGEIDVAAAATIPPRIRRVILRGLAVRPEDRHGSMDELVAELERARRPRWPLMLGVPVVLAIAASAWVAMRPDPATDPCTLGATRVSAVWNDTRRAQLSITEGGLSDAAARGAAERLTHAVDEYAASLAELHDEVCRIARTTDDPSIPPRRACVEDRLAGLAGLVEFLTTHEIAADAVQRFVETLPPLAACGPDRPSAWEPFPTDPKLAARVAALREQLREIALRNALGDLRDAESELVALVDEARTLAFPHLVASALARLAWVEDELGRTDRAIRHSEEALRIALAAGHDWLAAFVVSKMLGQMAQNPALDSDAERWATVAEALLERDGGDERVLAQITSALGNVLYNRGEFAAALAQYQRAEAIERRSGAGDEELAASWVNQAAILAQLDRTDEALALVERAGPVLTAYYGPEHAETLRADQVRAMVQQLRGDLDAAITTAEASLETLSRSQSDRSREISAAVYNLGTMYARRGRLPEATAALARSRATWPVAGDGRSDAEFEELAAIIAGMAGAPATELAHVDRALELYENSTGQREGAVARGRLLRADVLMDLGRWREALAELDEVWPRWHGAQFFTVMSTSDGVLAAHASSDAAAQALWLARMEASPAIALEDAVRARFTRAVVRGARDPEVLAALRRDRDLLVETGAPGMPLVRRIEQWIAGTWPGAVTNAPR